MKKKIIRNKNQTKKIDQEQIPQIST